MTLPARTIHRACVALGLAGALLLLLAPAQAALFDPLGIRSQTLSNGLRVIVQEEPESPVVAVEVVVRAGAADETPGREGLAHLLEHVLWAKGGDNDPRAAIEDVGGTTNAGTRRDFTHYYATVPRGNLAVAVRALGRIVLQNDFEQSVIDRERRVIQEEVAGREDDPSALLSTLTFETVYGREHPYGHAMEGSGPSLSSLGPAELGTFHRLWYGPNNLALVVVGAADIDSVVTLAGQVFGALVPGPVAAHQRGDVVRPAPARTATIGTSLPDTYLMAAFVGPEIAEPTEVCATDVLTVLLSNASYGRLKRRLQDQSNLVKTMGVDFLTQRDRALLGIWVRCDAKDVPRVEEEIQAELTRLATEPIPSKELAIAKRLTLSSYAFANEAASDRATTLAFYESLNSYREAGLYAGRVRGLTEADIRKVAQWYAGAPTWVLLSQQQKGVT